MCTLPVWGKKKWEIEKYANQHALKALNPSPTADKILVKMEVDNTDSVFPPSFKLFYSPIRIRKNLDTIPIFQANKLPSSQRVAFRSSLLNCHL